MSLWDTEEQADADGRATFYADGARTVRDAVPRRRPAATRTRSLLVDEPRSPASEVSRRCATCSGSRSTRSPSHSCCARRPGSSARVVALALRNVVFFRLGLRNVCAAGGRTQRLIVVGLMLATTIIAAALGTGDTMGRTIRSSVVNVAREHRRAREAEDGGHRRDRVRRTRDRDRPGRGDRRRLLPADRLRPRARPGRRVEPRRRRDARDLGRVAVAGHDAAGRPSRGSPCSRPTRTPRRVRRDHQHGHGQHRVTRRSSVRGRCTSTARPRASSAPAPGITSCSTPARSSSPSRSRDIVDFQGSGSDQGAVLLPLAHAAATARTPPARSSRSSSRTAAGRSAAPTRPPPSAGCSRRRCRRSACRPSRSSATASRPPTPRATRSCSCSRRSGASRSPPASC